MFSWNNDFIKSYGRKSLEKHIYQQKNLTLDFSIRYFFTHFFEKNIYLQDFVKKFKKKSYQDFFHKI
jgi:hypothetical protein